jgi:hypothetical protein
MTCRCYFWKWTTSRHSTRPTAIHGGCGPTAAQRGDPGEYREADSPSGTGTTRSSSFCRRTNLAGGFHVAERIRLYFQSIVFRPRGISRCVSSVQRRSDLLQTR